MNIKIAIFSAVFLLSALLLLIAILGHTSIFTTLSFYFIIFSILLSICKRLAPSDRRKEISLLIVSVCLSLLGAELALRYIFKLDLSFSEQNGKMVNFSSFRGDKMYNFISTCYPNQQVMGWVSHPPNSTKTERKSEFTYVHEYNALGLRDDNLPVLEDDTQQRIILCLGDSFTEGIGAAQDSTWPALLNRKCQSQNPDWLALNGGVAGGDPFFNYKNLERLLELLDFDMVMLCINSTDIVDVMLRGGHERFGENGQLNFRHDNKGEYFYQFSYLTRRFFYGVLHLTPNLLTEREENLLRQEALLMIEELITQDFANLAKRYSFTPVIIFHPLRNEWQENKWPFDSLIARLKRQNTLHVIDLKQHFIHKSLQQIDTYYWPIDGHHNGKGYQLWADIIFSEIDHSMYPERTH